MRSIGCAGVCLSIVLAISLPPPAFAGLVHGRVSDAKGKPQPRVALRVLVAPGKEVSVTTGQDGSYSIVLPPGSYTVVLPDGTRTTILSLPEPIRQDIQLGR